MEEENKEDIQKMKQKGILFFHFLAFPSFLCHFFFPNHIIYLLLMSTCNKSIILLYSIPFCPFKTTSNVLFSPSSQPQLFIS